MLGAWTRNYDFPQNALGEPLPPLIQASYAEGEEIVVEVMVTTHHKGHFEFKACSIVPLLGDTTASSLSSIPLPLAAPTQECFSNGALAVVEDLLYGAPPDVNYPERAYIAPAGVVEYTNGIPAEQPVRGTLYKFKLKLPEGLTGEVVLLQWYYLTANR